MIKKESEESALFYSLELFESGSRTINDLMNSDKPLDANTFKSLKSELSNMKLNVQDALQTCDELIEIYEKCNS